MMQYLQKLVGKLKASEKGQGMVEYALIIAFVAAIAIVALNGTLKETVSNAFDQAASGVSAATDKASSDFNG